LKQIRKRLTYANVMSSLAVFLILGGATAFAAVQKIGANEIKANSIKTGKIVKEAVTAGKIKNAAVTEGKIADGAVTTNKIADSAVTTAKIANDAVTGDKVKESSLGEVPLAAEAKKVTGGAAGGALAGTYPNPTIAAKAISGVNFAASGTFTLDPGSIAANTCEYELPSVPGATNQPDETTIVEPPEQVAGAGVSATAMRSNSNNLIRLLFCNPTAGAINPPSGVYTYLVISQ
jgi:hypothetical protein